jgi:hypothetical protein
MKIKQVYSFKIEIENVVNDAVIKDGNLITAGYYSG